MLDISVLPHVLISLAIYTVAINLIAYSASYMDKRLARQREQRISESSLLWLAALGGTAGAITAQHKFRHKTRKQPFKSQLYAIGCLQGAFLLALMHPDIRETGLAALS